MTDRFTHDAGPYVLGALPPEDRRAFEEHLATCGHCRSEVQEFAGLPGLLSRLPAGELPAVLQGSPEPPPPVSVLPAPDGGSGGAAPIAWRPWLRRSAVGRRGVWRTMTST